MKMERGQFEALLLEIAEFAEEWLTSAQSMGLARRMEANRVLPWGSGPVSPTSNGNRRRPVLSRVRPKTSAMRRA